MGRELDDVDAASIMVFVQAGNAFVAEAGERLDGADIEANVLPANLHRDRWINAYGSEHV